MLRIEMSAGTDALKPWNLRNPSRAQRLHTICSARKFLRLRLPQIAPLPLPATEA